MFFLQECVSKRRKTLKITIPTDGKLLFKARTMRLYIGSSLDFGMKAYPYL